MRGTAVTRSYADTLLELARRDDAIDEYALAMGGVADLVRGELEFRRLLDTPRVSADAKKRVLADVLGDRVPANFLRFLYVVIDKGRQRRLPEIADEFAERVDEHYGRIQVRVTLAIEPDAELRRALRERLGAIFEREVLPLFSVDPRILGGVIVRAGDRVMDGSLRRRLRSLRQALMRVELPEAGGDDGAARDESRTRDR